MAKRTARLLALAALALAAGACGGRAEAAEAYRAEFTGQPDAALAQIRDSGCETDRFWARQAVRGEWIPWFDTDVAAANALFRDHDGFVPFPPENVPLFGAEIIAWCGDYVPATPGPDPGPEPGPTPNADPREGVDLSAARARVAAAHYNDEARWRDYRFSEAELDRLTSAPRLMPFLPAMFCTVQEGRPPWVGAEAFRGWVRDAERAWDEAAGQDVVEYMGDCGPPADDDSSNGVWNEESVRLRWEIARDNGALGGTPLALTRGVVRFASLPADRQGDAQARGAPRESVSGSVAPPPHPWIRISDRAPATAIPTTIVHEMGHALTLEHSGSPGELMWTRRDDPVRSHQDLSRIENENAAARTLSAREAAILRAAIARVRAAPDLGYGDAFTRRHAIQYDRELRRIFGATPSTEYDADFDAHYRECGKWDGCPPP